MKIKSLLAASAAMIVSAPAFAADVIIAEPEPVDYVEVCDVAGAGYFYIPGSQTCLQIGGLVRHELQFNGDRARNNSGVLAVRNLDITGGGVTDLIIGDGEEDGIDSLVRAELTARTYTETELGALTSYIRFRANDINAAPQTIVANNQSNQIDVLGANANGSAFVNDATLGLGGLLMGMSDTLFDGGINGEFDSLGGNRVHFIRYTADLGAFSASLSLEAERQDVSRFDYVPNVVGQLSGDLGAFSVDLWAAYDDADNAKSVRVPPQNLGITELRFNDDEVALKARAGFDLGAVSAQVAGTYNSGVNYYTNGYEYSIAASASFGLSEKAELTFGGQYFANAQALVTNAAFNAAAAGNVVNGPIGFRSVENDNADEFRIGADVKYTIVDGFDMRVAVNYIDLELDGPGVVDPDGEVSGFIRFDRSF